MSLTFRRLAVLGAGLAAVLSACAQVPPGPDNADAAALQRGKRLFLRCAACHDTTPTGLPKTGPHLQGIAGRRAAALEGYAYSPALKAQSFEWDAARLDAWLAQPSAVVPGTTMVFIGLPEAEDRRSLIAYLRTLK